jgi:thymidylate synthase (FAD)
MGEDLDVANVARVSFDKQSQPEEDGSISLKDIKLIGYLAEHNHWSPFAHCFAQFRIKAPIFVARQLQKHTVGLAWNEVSRRYVDSEPEFYIPSHLRTRAENVKQGSGHIMLSEFNQHSLCSVHEATKSGLRHYQRLLKNGVCPEQARMVLPQNTMTEWIWSGSLMAFARVCKLRLDSHTQAETRIVAAGIDEALEELFPFSWASLMSH